MNPIASSSRLILIPRATRASPLLAMSADTFPALSSSLLRSIQMPRASSAAAAT